MLDTSQKLANIPQLFLPLLFKTAAVIITILIAATALLLPTRVYSAELKRVDDVSAAVTLRSENGGGIEYTLYRDGDEEPIGSGSCEDGAELLFTQLEPDTVYRIVMTGSGPDGNFYFNTLHKPTLQPGGIPGGESTSGETEPPEDGTDITAPPEDTTQPSGTPETSDTADTETTAGTTETAVTQDGTHLPANIPTEIVLEAGQSDENTPPEAFIGVDWERDASDSGSVYMDYSVYSGANTSGTPVKSDSLEVGAEPFDVVLNGLDRGKYTIVCTLSYVDGGKAYPLDTQAASAEFLSGCMTAVNAPTAFSAGRVSTESSDFMFNMTGSWKSDKSDYGDMVGKWEIQRVSDGVSVDYGEQAFSDFGTPIKVGSIKGAEYNIVCTLVFRNEEGSEYTYLTSTISKQVLYTTSPVNTPTYASAKLVTNADKNLTFTVIDKWNKTAADGAAEVYYNWTLFYKSDNGDTKAGSGKTALGDGGFAGLIEETPTNIPEQGKYYAVMEVVFKSDDGYQTVLDTFTVNGFLAYKPQDDITDLYISQGQMPGEIIVMLVGGAPDEYGECYVHIDIKDSNGSIVASIDVPYETLSTDQPLAYAPELPTGEYSMEGAAYYKVTTGAEFAVYTSLNTYNVW